jgi:3',5'-cyclic AMP phosphodiesterase CpdA
MTVRLAHFSDIHLTDTRLGWTRRDMMSKKITGWLNVKLLGRGRRFRHATAVTDVLIADFRERNFDTVVFSGDATTLAFEREFAAAAARMGVGVPDHPPGFAVPGNHDYYTPRCYLAGHFEKYFAPWQHGERIGEETYPFARKVGHVWLIGVNSGTPNFWTWDASGAVGPAQRERLRELGRQLDDGPKVLVTHYPLRTARGKVEVRPHRLRDHVEVLAIAKEIGVSLWLHGHIHRGFVLRPSEEIPFPVICAGSCTQTRRWAYNDYTIEGTTLRGVRRLYNQLDHQFKDGEHFELHLPTG